MHGWPRYASPVPASSPLSSALEKLINFTWTSNQRTADEPWLGRAVDAWFAGTERVVAD